MLIDLCMKFHKNSLNGFQVIVRTRLRYNFVMDKVPRETRIVRGSDYSPAIELSEQKDKLVTATGETEKYSDEQANKVWINSVYWF